MDFGDAARRLDTQDYESDEQVPPSAKSSWTHPVLVHDKKPLTSLIQPLIDQLEARRVKALRKHQWRVRVALALGSLFTLSLFWGTALPQNTLMQVGIGGFLLLGIWAYLPVLNYRKAFKSRFMPQVVRAFGDFSFKGDKALDSRALVPSAIFNEAWHYHSEDSISGAFGTTRVTFGEAVMSDPRRPRPAHARDKRLRGPMMFSGMFVLITLPQTFKGRTFVTAKRGTLMEKAAITGTALRAINLQDSTLNRYFDVYSDNVATTSSILSLATMDALVALHKNLFNAPLEASFYKNNVFIMLPYTNNLFEPKSIYKPAFSMADLPLLEQHFAILKTLCEGLSYNQTYAAA